MLWHELFTADNKPSEEQIGEYIGSPLWEDLAAHMGQAYKAVPNFSFSKCAMDGGFWKGWNVKYKKSGKSLCTLYPKEDFFVALINIGAKEADAAEALLPKCAAYTQKLYTQTNPEGIGKFLGMHVKTKLILRDLKNLLALRVPPLAG